MDRLSIHRPNDHHTWGIQLESNDENKIRQFIKLCKTQLDQRLLPFHQSGRFTNGDNSHYQFFEFWGVDETNIDFMLDECMKIADMMGMELEID